MTSLHYKVKDYLRTGNEKKLAETLTTLMPVELEEILSNLSFSSQLKILNMLPQTIDARTFELLPLGRQKKLIHAFSSEKAASVLNALAPDDRVALFERLSGSVVNQLIKLLSNEERILTLELLGYPENSVGRLMTPDYISVKQDWNVQDVIDYIRKNGKDSETVNVVYVVDDQGHLLDDLRIREILLADPNKKVSEICDKKVATLFVNADEETAINIFRKYNRVALPVIDEENYLLGIVTIDDVLHLAKTEDTEHMQRIGGVQALDEPYMSVPFFTLMRKRGGWLIILFLSEMLTATAMGYFQDEISRAVVLTLFLPLIMSSGGNSGSQASTLIICALSLGEVGIKDWWKIMKREICSGLFLGMLLGTIAFFRIVLWTTFTSIYGTHWLLLATTVGLALVGVVLWGTLAGSMLPILLKRLGFDPAVSSAPFVATLIDVTGIVIYFGIALIILSGTLL